MLTRPFIRLDRAPEDIVNHLPTRIWSGRGWEKESVWLRKLRRRAQTGQSVVSIDKPREEPTLDLESQAPTPHTPANEERGNADSAGGRESLALTAPHSNSPSEDYGATDQEVVPGSQQPWFNGQTECVSPEFLYRILRSY